MANKIKQIIELTGKMTQEIFVLLNEPDHEGFPYRVVSHIHENFDKNIQDEFRNYPEEQYCWRLIGVALMESGELFPVVWDEWIGFKAVDPKLIKLAEWSAVHLDGKSDPDASRDPDRWDVIE